VPLDSNVPGSNQWGCGSPNAHELLGLMLDVRRATVSEVLRPLQERDWVHSNRGEITVLNRKVWNPVVANATP